MRNFFRSSTNCGKLMRTDFACQNVKNTIIARSIYGFKVRMQIKSNYLFARNGTKIAINFSAELNQKRNDKKTADTTNIVWFIRLFAIWIDISIADCWLQHSTPNFGSLLRCLNAWIKRKQFKNGITFALCTTKILFFFSRRRKHLDLTIFIHTHNFAVLCSLLCGK